MKVARNRAYTVESENYLTKPFVSMYVGVAYLLWLSEYERLVSLPLLKYINLI